MSEPVLIAVIGACGVVVAALINAFVKSKSGSKTIVKQKNKGKEQTTQVGIMNLNVGDKQENGKKS